MGLDAKRWAPRALLSGCCVALHLVATGALAQTSGLGQSSGAVLIPSPTPADARDRTGPVPVTQRKRPGLDAEGFWYDGVHLQPGGSITSLYDSNILASGVAPQSDFILHFRPNLRLDNGTGLFSYVLELYADRSHYVSHSEFDNTKAGATFNVVGDLSPKLRVESRTSYLHDYADPSSIVLPVPTAGIAKLPVHDTFGQQVSATSDVSRLAFTVTGGFVHDEYEDVTVNGVIFRQSQLSGNTVSLTPRVAYDLTPLLRTFVQGDYRHQDTKSRTLNAGTYALSGGFDFEFRRLFRGTVSLGYSKLVYDSGSQPSADGLTYGIDLAWFPTELLTVGLSGQQSFSQTILVGLGGQAGTSNNQSIRLQADYEVLPQWLLGATLGYANADVGSANRKDDTVSAALGLTYSMNRYAALVGRYAYSKTSSSQSGFSFDRHQVGLGLNLQF